MAASNTRRRTVWTAMLVASLASSAAAQTAPLSRDQMAEFLRSARIIHHKGIPKGVTQPTRLTLSDGSITHDAAFSAVDEHNPVMHFENGRTELNFVDSYEYTLAAYAVGELLGLEDMMPVTVAREWDHHKGALSWWVDNVKWDEGQRLKLGVAPPDPEAWNHKMYRMRVFTQLVGDTDRNVGNVLISADWHLWMIDFTRAFRRNKKLLAPNDVQRCDRKVLERLRTLTEDELKAATKGYLGGGEIEALLARRDEIVARIDALVAERGEDRVLY
jgi:hypothetical protein